MSIKITPSNIFQIQHTAIPLNSYENVSVDERNYVVSVGSVSESKTFTFYEKQVEVSENGTTTTTLVNVINTANQGTTFLDDPWIEIAQRGRGVIATLSMNISEKTKIDTEAIVNDKTNIKISSHSLRRETRIFDAVVAGDKVVGGTEYTIVTFERPFTAKIASSPQTIDVNYSAHILQTDPSYPNKAKYILSETLYIEGQCFKDTDNTVAKYDEEIVAKNILQLPTNELIQGGNYYIRDSRNYSDEFISEVYAKYNGGKETATLLCSVGKYYDLDGNLVVDAENEDATIQPLLKKYDIVVPYIMTYRGEVPLSTDAEGNAKQFQIIGVNISYNGIARQEIVIQEYKTT